MNSESHNAEFHEGALMLNLRDKNGIIPAKEQRELTDSLEPSFVRKKQIAGKTIFLPENFDAYKHLKDNPPKGFRPSIDRLNYLISLIIEIPYRDKNLFKHMSSDGDIPFVNLSSQLLKKRIHNYDSYLKYLIASGVLETNNQYCNGKYCKGYRLSEAYRTSIRIKRIFDSNLIFGTNKESIGFEKAEERYSNLIYWFDGLQFDKSLATKYLDKIFREDGKKCRVNDKIILKHNIYRIMVERMANKDYFFNVDSYSNRFHSILTNLKKEFRNFVTYNDKKLVSIDLSGSQPFLILNLLNSDFYDSNNDLFNLKTINHNINPLISLPPPCAPINSIMCGTFEDKNAKSEIELYKRLVKHNQFYEYCMKPISQIEGKDISRSTVKTIMLSVLFSSNDEKHPFLVRNKDIFKKVFPFISTVLEAWKIDNGNNLAKVLQKIESYLILDCICNRISHEMPSLPIFTVHDSIVTVKGSEHYVREVMYDEIQKRTKFNPHFKMEIWEPNF